MKQEKLLTVRGPPEEPGLECPSVWPTGTPAFFTVTQARGVDVTGNLTILGVRIPITVPGWYLLLQRAILTSCCKRFITVEFSLTNAVSFSHFS